VREGWGTRGFVALSAEDKKRPRFISRGSPTKPYRKSGRMGHPEVGCGEIQIQIIILSISGKILPIAIRVEYASLA
jgi:hypothetical protein